jgi:uncharacterized protein YndB with AHSA1/START domain
MTREHRIDSSEPGSRFEVNRKAPAFETAEVYVEAPIGKVWSVLSDLERWPSWNPGVSKIRIDGPVRAGTCFEWAGNGSKIVSRLEETDPPRRIAWTGKTLGIRARHVWELSEKGTGTLVRTEESFDGLAARLFRGFARKTLAKALAQGVSSLKAAAESSNL